jgi:hypothetical protein
MSAIINGDSPSITFSDGTTQATSAIVSGKVPFTNLPAGSVLQVVQQLYTTYTTTTSTSLVDSGITVSITPKFSTSKVLVMATVTCGTAGTAYDVVFQFVRNSTNIGTGTASTVNNYSFVLANGAGNHSVSIPMNYLDSPATTSATTYKLQWRVQGGTTATLNASGSVSGGTETYQSGYISTITVMEIAG